MSIQFSTGMPGPVAVDQLNNLSAAVAASVTQSSDAAQSVINAAQSTLDSKVALASAQATLSGSSAAAANTSAGASSGSASQTLAIYGTTAAMNSALAGAAAQNAAAQNIVASAASVMQQDLSAVAAALHRSPNTIAAMFIYDTSKDSDGGAWVDRMQSASWANEPLCGTWLKQQVSESAARAVSGATTGDYYQLTTDGRFYRLLPNSGTSETQRGNKSGFPRVVGLVAETVSALIRVVAYDLTEPGCPMWGCLGSSIPAHSASSVTCLAALNGKIFIGVAGYPGYAILDLPRSVMTWDGSGFSGQGTGLFLLENWTTGIPGDYFTTTRPTSYTTFVAGASKLIDSTVYSVAMTVLPDAPLSAATGLARPTIAVMTAGGVSVMRHDGVVSSQAFTGNSIDSIVISNAFLYYTNAMALHGYRFIRLSAITSTTFVGSVVGATPLMWAGGTKMKPTRLGGFIGATGGIAPFYVSQYRQNESVATGVINSRTASDYTTGFMTGDIRRAYLSDVNPGVIATGNRISNGQFDTDTTGWTSMPAYPGTASAVSGEMQVTSSIGYGGVSTPITCVIGSVYQVSGTARTISGGGSAYIARVSSAGDDLNYSGSSASSTATLVSLYFTADATTCYISARNTVNGGVGGFDNISVKEVVIDRSYKAGALAIAGTLTKTQVAAAAQLVAFSGFSATNYLSESYSSDFDFGTGAWSAAVNLSTAGSGPSNLVTNSEFPNGLADVANSSGSVSAATIAWGGFTTGIAFGTNAGNTVAYKQLVLGATGAVGVVSAYVKMDDGNAPSFGSSMVTDVSNDFTIVINGIAISPPANSVVSLGSGIYRISATGSLSATLSNYGIIKFAGNSTRTFVVTGYSVTVGPTAQPYLKTTTSLINGVAVITDRSAATGPSIKFGIDGYGCITASAYDGTTTRKVTAPTANNNGAYVSAVVNYRIDGSLALVVNGEEVARTTGAPLLTMNNSAAVLTVGNSRLLDAPFPGALALLKISATVPTAEQSAWIYGQERGMFRPGAQVTLPAATAVTDLAYDEATDKWTAIQAGYESSWNGLVRVSANVPSAGTFSGVATSGERRLLARNTTNPGVDITAPAKLLRSELAKQRPVQNLKSALFNFDTVTFTGSTTNTSSSVTSVVVSAGVPSVGMLVAGIGIAANTTIIAIAGTTYTLSIPATATSTGATIYQPQTDFSLPVGYTVSEVEVAGLRSREGVTKSWVRVFDGFVETVRFNVVQGANVWIQIYATKEV